MQTNNTHKEAPCSKDLTLADMQRTLDEITTAFPKNDDGKPDYYGHRESHKEAAAKKKSLSDYQNKFTEKLVIGVASATVGLMTIVGTGLGDLIVQIIRGK